jgi:hypothetical protein
MSCLLETAGVHAEGTKQVMPNQNNGTGLIVSTTTSFPLGNVGSYLGAPNDDRIYFHIKDFSTEVLYYGFNWEPLSPSGTPNTGTYNDVFMNVYDPSGTLVTTVNLPSTVGTPGFIGGTNAYINASAGPKISGIPSNGYSPLSFSPAMNGDYYVSFYRSTDGGATHISGGESMLAKYFDMTIAAGAARYPGRVHCNEWAFSVYNPSKNDIQDPASPTNAVFYGYTPDSVTVRVSFPATGFMPLSYIVAFNSFGVKNSGNWVLDRNSINLPTLVSPYLTGGFDVFLNPPDASLYPACVIPSPPILLAPVISGCPPGPYNIRFKAPQSGDYYLLFDLNGVPGFQNNTADRFIELISQSPGIVTFVWDGRDGLNNVVPANTTFPIIFSYRKGRINIPFYDVELNVNGFRVDGVSPAAAVQSNAILYWNDSQLTTGGVGTSCTSGSSNNNNSGGNGYDNSVVGVQPVWPATPPVPTYGRAWNGNGNVTNATPADSVSYSGTWNNQDNLQCNDFGNARLLNTWAWGITLDTTQLLTLTCITVSGTVWDDADGSANGGFTNIHTNSEVGTNVANVLYASLVDPVTGNVVSTTPVASDGTYTLTNCPVNAVGMQVWIDTRAGIIGSHPQGSGVPSDWITTSGLVETFSSGSAPVTGVDFGIERLPNSNDQNYTIAMPVQNTFLPLNGSGTVASPGPLTGSDPEDGIMGSGKTVVITSVPSNEQLYYNGTLVTNGYQITNYNPTLLSVKFTSVTTLSTSFTYAYVDAAGKQDPNPATYTINMSIVLSTSLGTFTGKATDLGNVLTWTSLDELPSMHFIIQRSTSGSNYAPIGEAEATGNHTNVDHSFTDNSPTPNTPNYYRLEWTDASGNIAYSNVVTISDALVSGVLEVTPNPFKDQVTVRLSLNSTQKVAIRLLDGKGMLVQQGQYEGVKGVNAFDLDGLSGLPVSVYLVQIVLIDQVFVRKVFNTR